VPDVIFNLIGLLSGLRHQQLIELTTARRGDEVEAVARDLVLKEVFVHERDQVLPKEVVAAVDPVPLNDPL